MKKQLKEAEARAAAQEEHEDDPDIVMADDNKKRKYDKVSGFSDTEGALKKTTLEAIAHPPDGDGVGDGTSKAQAVDVDEVIIVDGESFDVVILD